MAINAGYELPYTGEQVEELLGKVTANETAIEDISDALGNKVDKVTGKGLSTNDYTSDDRMKLSRIESGAQKNVQADWNASSGDAYIRNKPDITGKADASAAIGSLTLSMNNSNYQITLSGTKVDGTAFTVSGVIDLPLESVVVSGTYNNTTKKVILTLQNGSTVEFSVADLVSGLQTEITSSNKLSADLVQDGETNKVFTASEKTKLSGLDAQIQSDWNQTNTGAKDYIKNKPNIPQGVTVDSALSSTSENPVQNKVINSALGNKQDTLTFDSTPTANSTNPVTSAGIKSYVDNATPTITMDDTPTSGSNNPVKSGGIYTALQGKQNTLTFDSTPTASSTNPVTSGGVKTALDLKANQSTTYTKTEVDGLLEDVAYLGDDDGQATTLDFDPQADTVWNIPQTLGSSQQAQARANIGVVDVSGTNDGTNWTSITIGSTTKAIPAGGGSGDVNVIETVKVNGTALVPDANKAVDITVPSAVTESTVSGWGFTKNAGTVTSVTVNSVNHTPVNGVVDLGTISGGGGSVTVDSQLNTSSTNPVQNSVITTALNGKEDNSNKVTSLSSSSTDTQYPSAKCVYDIIGDIESLLASI